jgi:hypothetical protein
MASMTKLVTPKVITGWLVTPKVITGRLVTPKVITGELVHKQADLRVAQLAAELVYFKLT